MELGFQLGVLDLLLLAAVRLNLRADDAPEHLWDGARTAEVEAALASKDVAIGPEERQLLAEMDPPEMEFILDAAARLAPKT